MPPKAIFLLVLVLTPLSAADWVDLMPPDTPLGQNIPGWTRIPIPAIAGLKPEPQWKVDGAQKLLICTGQGGHEWLRYDKPLGDFVFHVEFRFTPVAGNPRYNSGIFVRTLPDYSLWYQLQIGSKAGGYFFGYLYLNGEKRRFDYSPLMVDQRVKAAGEWNTAEVTARGPVLTSWVNGAVVNEWKYCPVEKGHIGLEAEGFRIEFRNLKVKTLEPARLQ
jgi:hypothetical protein